MTVSLAALSAPTYWAIALSIGLGAAVIVAILLTVLVEAVGSIEKSVDGLLDYLDTTPAAARTTPPAIASLPDREV